MHYNGAGTCFFRNFYNAAGVPFLIMYMLYSIKFGPVEAKSCIKRPMAEQWHTKEGKG